MSKGERRVYQGVARGQPFEIEVDGEKIVAYEGESIGAALLAAGRRTLRYKRCAIPISSNSPGAFIAVSDCVRSAA
jgi:hypothetical protein